MSAGFQLADQGTLFLDEIGEIPLETQGKLLRVLQEGEFERVGEAKTRRADVRIIAATNRSLKEGRSKVAVSVRTSTIDSTSFPSTVPPLRYRGEDTQLLATHYLERAVRKLKPRTAVAHDRPKASQLLSYDWPGQRAGVTRM